MVQDPIVVEDPIEDQAADGEAMDGEALARAGAPTGTRPSPGRSRAAPRPLAVAIVPANGDAQDAKPEDLLKGEYTVRGAGPAPPQGRDLARRSAPGRAAPCRAARHSPAAAARRPQWTLHEFNLQPDKVTSDPFEIGGYQWCAGGWMPLDLRIK